MNLMGICTSFEKCLLISFAYLFGLLVFFSGFFFLSFLSSLDINPLSDAQWAKMFSHSAGVSLLW
jgi:hypothetical protein